MDALARLRSSLADRYTVERLIGTGGMATVYLARDVRHHRPVAIKLLNPELGAVLGTERFLSEIRVTANLQHPNLLPLFDSGEADGQLFYVMPFVEGESLRAKLDREKQLSINEATRIGAAIAGALDYAHRHGVVHRDLKPENILLHDGQPLVADFGIALAVSNAGGERVTQTGLSLGTPQYMSPEQATGERSIDSRSDIYSLGAVIYEMLTGEPPHTGGTVQAIIARVVTDTPRDIRISRPSIPDHVADAVAKALEKVPADRFENAREFSEALQGERAISGRTTVRRTATASRHTFSKPAIAACAVLVLLAAAAFIYATSQRRALAAARDSVQVARFSVSIPGDVSADAGLAISPDGQTIVYSARTGDSLMLFARPVAEWNARIIPGTRGGSFPFFSPDGMTIGFTSNKQLRKVSVNGGSPTAILSDFQPSARAHWATDGRIYFARSWIARGRLGLSSISANGGAVRTVTLSDSSRGIRHYSPIVIDGETVVFVSFGPLGQEDDFLAIGSVKSGKFTTLTIRCWRLLGIVDSHAVCLADGVLTATKIDVRSQERVGEPITLTGSATSLAIMSESGTMVDFDDISQTKLIVVDPANRQTDVVPLVATWSGLELSPDGQRVAALIGGNTEPGNVGIVDLRSNSLTKLTLEGADLLAWSPDNTNIYYTRANRADGMIWSTRVDGSTDPKNFKIEVPQNVAFTGDFSLSPDGKTAVIGVGSGRNPDDIYTVRLDGSVHRAMPWRKTNFIENGAYFSPDGKWVAYHSNEGGNFNVYIASYSNPEQRIRVSDGGGEGPLWSRDGRRLFFLKGDGPEDRVLAVADFDPVRFAVNNLHTFRVLSRSRAPGYRNYAVTGDDRLVATEKIGVEMKLAVTLNWAVDFRRQLQK